jgi:hypothetical protein
MVATFDTAVPAFWYTATGDVQEAASHAYPRTTMRTASHGILDWHATYVVSAYVTGAAR